jgi:hypothetical protein
MGVSGTRPGVMIGALSVAVIAGAFAAIAAVASHSATRQPATARAIVTCVCFLSKRCLTASLTPQVRQSLCGQQAPSGVNINTALPGFVWVT